MKSLKFILATVFSMLAYASSACGPDYYEIPHPSYMRLTDKIADLDTRAENLLLWQSQTSREIKLSDIEAVIYGDVTPDAHGPYNDSCHLDETEHMSWSYDHGKKQLGDNTFLNYIYNTSDDEAFQFIMMAKHIARLRDDRNSPWYYPADKLEVSQSFDPVIKTIKAYKGKRFYNRYSLQLIRALFASAKYEDCIAAFDERFANVPEDDLMKRMSRDYVAGAALRLGDSKTATDYFASTGDVESISRFSSVEDPFRLAALTNPNSPKLLYYIEQHFNGTGYYSPCRTDSLVVKESILPAAKKVVKMKHVKNRAMWYYILAVGEGEFNNNYENAYRYIKEASRHPQGGLADNIHGYRIVAEAALGKQGNLLSNLKWLESKIADVTSPDKNYWEQVMQNLVFTRIAPWYAERGDVITALQLANYGDNMPLKYSASCRRYSTLYGNWQTDEILPARKDPGKWNCHDYSNTFFQFMTMQTPRTIERYIASLSSKSPLALYLNSRSYTSRDYLYDVAGTLYLAKRDYADAIRALSHVSGNYQKLLNVDRHGFLRRDPFVYQSELQKSDWHEHGHSYNPGPGPKDGVSNHKKLFFAREMLRLEQQIRSSHNPNARALARLKYAIGLENSFTSCWALTSYSHGSCLIAGKNRLTDRQKSNESAILKATADAEVMRNQALAEITDPEVAAKAHHMLYDVLTIARRYPETAIGRMMAAECDAWSDWVKAPAKPQKLRKAHS